MYICLHLVLGNYIIVTNGVIPLHLYTQVFFTKYFEISFFFHVKIDLRLAEIDIRQFKTCDGVFILLELFNLLHIFEVNSPLFTA